MNNNMKLLRNFHNRIKSKLLQTACKQFLGISTYLLDVGVGRGGDIFKWDKCGLHNVDAYDPSESSIEEAKRRYVSLQHVRNYQFFVCDNIEHAPNKMYDIISCQFAIHYLCSSESTFRSFVKHISARLKPNGVFIGTCMNGERVCNLLNGNQSYENEAFYITKDNVHKNTYGDAINIYLYGTLYFGEKTVSKEYLVYDKSFIEVCSEYGLRLEFKTSFQEYYEHMPNYKMNNAHKVCSFLYDSFCFTKVT